MTLRMVLAIALSVMQLAPADAIACSAFSSSSANFRLMGKSYDFQLSHGIALINKRNVKKSSLVSRGDTPVHWISKYGSLTYTQFGREFPLSGINEKGLAIEILWDYSTDGPSNRGPLPAINEAQWIQYQLDISADVPDVIANSRRVRMMKVFAPIHYLVCDAPGQCVVFEFDGDHVQITEVSRVPVLTNTQYMESLHYLGGFAGFGGRQPIPYGSYQSNDRFVILNAQLKDFNAKTSAADGVAFGWEMLKKVKSRGHTQWHIMHDLKNGVSHFRRMFEERVTRVTDLKRFDFSCRKPALILDLESEDNGDTTSQYRPYDAALNRETVEISGVALAMNRDLIEAAAKFPDTTVCTE